MSILSLDTSSPAHIRYRDDIYGRSTTPMSRLKIFGSFSFAIFRSTFTRFRLIDVSETLFNTHFIEGVHMIGSFFSHYANESD